MKKSCKTDQSDAVKEGYLQHDTQSYARGAARNRFTHWGATVSRGTELDRESVNQPTLNYLQVTTTLSHPCNVS